MTRILCFGDSLTHGTKPVPFGHAAERYDASERWTGILQTKLGPDVTVIEEGLPSRTIDLDDPRPGKIGRNGSVYLPPCVGSHVPIDAIIIWLGTNDTKDIFGKSAPQIADSMRTLLTSLTTQLQELSQNTKILLVAPPKMNPSSEGAQQWYASAQPKLAELAALYEGLAEELGIAYSNSHDFLGEPAIPDGIHLSVEQNQIMAEQMYRALVEMGIVT
jgi:lysophospholipase L1-like esterase